MLKNFKVYIQSTYTQSTYTQRTYTQRTAQILGYVATGCGSVAVWQNALTVCAWSPGHRRPPSSRSPCHRRPPPPLRHSLQSCASAGEKKCSASALDQKVVPGLHTASTALSKEKCLERLNCTAQLDTAAETCG